MEVPRRKIQKFHMQLQMRIEMPYGLRDGKKQLATVSIELGASRPTVAVSSKSANIILKKVFMKVISNKKRETFDYNQPKEQARFTHWCGKLVNEQNY